MAKIVRLGVRRFKGYTSDVICKLLEIVLSTEWVKKKIDEIDGEIMLYALGGPYKLDEYGD